MESQSDLSGRQLDPLAPGSLKAKAKHLQNPKAKSSFLPLNSAGIECVFDLQKKKNH